MAVCDFDGCSCNLDRARIEALREREANDKDAEGEGTAARQGRKLSNMRVDPKVSFCCRCCWPCPRACRVCMCLALGQLCYWAPGLATASGKVAATLSFDETVANYIGRVFMLCSFANLTLLMKASSSD